MSKDRIVMAFGLAAGLCLLILFGARGARTQNAPKYKVDADWPKPLPNKWKMGGVTGLAVDKDDNVWVHDRPNDLTDIELEAELTPPIADCCIAASLHDPYRQGRQRHRLLRPAARARHGGGQQRIHLPRQCRQRDWQRPQIRSENRRACSPNCRTHPRCRRAVEEVTPLQTGPRVPGHGSSGPVAGFLPFGAPKPDPAARAAREAATAAFRAKYPPTTPMIVGGIEEVRLDEPAHELYAADNYLGGRVMVFDMDTFKFKRGWGAYGHKLSEITTDDKDRAYVPNGPEPKEFRGHLTLNVSHDGMVYAADRMANRIDVTTKEGKFVKEFVMAPWTGVGGSTGGVMFSPDKQQLFLYISDLTNNHIWFLNREDGKVVGQIGSMGQNAGQFYGLHMIAVDSKGDIYTGEVFGGERVQRFVPVK